MSKYSKAQPSKINSQSACIDSCKIKIKKGLTSISPMYLLQLLFQIRVENGVPKCNHSNLTSCHIVIFRTRPSPGTAKRRSKNQSLSIDVPPLVDFRELLDFIRSSELHMSQTLGPSPLLEAPLEPNRPSRHRLVPMSATSNGLHLAFIPNQDAPRSLNYFSASSRS
jgi:hypothetical protein